MKSAFSPLWNAHLPLLSFQSGSSEHSTTFSLPHSMIIIMSAAEPMQLKGGRTLLPVFSLTAACEAVVISYDMSDILVPM